MWRYRGAGILPPSLTSTRSSWQIPRILENDRPENLGTKSDIFLYGLVYDFGTAKFSSYFRKVRSYSWKVRSYSWKVRQLKLQIIKVSTKLVGTSCIYKVPAGIVNPYSRVTAGHMNMRSFQDLTRIEWSLRILRSYS